MRKMRASNNVIEIGESIENGISSYHAERWSMTVTNEDVILLSALLLLYKIRASYAFLYTH